MFTPVEGEERSVNSRRGKVLGDVRGGGGERQGLARRDLHCNYHY